jgi:hypothetical protein
MGRKNKAQYQGKTSTPPSFRKHHYKRQKRPSIPAAPDFTCSDSEEAHTPRAPTPTSYRVVVTSDTSDDDTRLDSNNSMSFHPYRQPGNAPQFNYRVALGDTTDDSDDAQVHACLLPLESGFRPCCLPLSAVWSGSTLRMHDCFRENLLGGKHIKTQTMRPEWCASTIRQHTRLFEKGSWFRVNCGGQGNVKTIGWARYVSVDMVQLQHLNSGDCAREGRPQMSVADFLEKFLLRGAISHKEAYTRSSGKHVPARCAKPAITPLTTSPRFRYEFVPCVSAGKRNSRPSGVPS